MYLCLNTQFSGYLIKKNNLPIHECYISTLTNYFKNILKLIPNKKILNLIVMHPMYLEFLDLPKCEALFEKNNIKIVPLPLSKSGYIDIKKAGFMINELKEYIRIIDCPIISPLFGIKETGFYNIINMINFKDNHPILFINLNFCRELDIKNNISIMDKFDTFYYYMEYKTEEIFNINSNKMHELNGQNLHCFSEFINSFTFPTTGEFNFNELIDLKELFCYYFNDVIHIHNSNFVLYGIKGFDTRIIEKKLEKKGIVIKAFFSKELENSMGLTNYGFIQLNKTENIKIHNILDHVKDTLEEIFNEDIIIPIPRLDFNKIILDATTIDKILL